MEVIGIINQLSIMSSKTEKKYRNLIKNKDISWGLF